VKVLTSRGKYPNFWRYPNSLPTQCRISPGKPLCQKARSLFILKNINSAVFLQCRLVTETGWLGVVSALVVTQGHWTGNSAIRYIAHMPVPISVP